MTIPHHDCPKTITSLIHQFWYQGKKSQSTELDYAKTQPRSIPFATKLFTPHILCIWDNSPPRFHKNHNFSYSPILLPRQKKANPPNLAKRKPNQDKFLLRTNFWHLIFYAFVTIPHQDFTKTITSLINQFCYQGKKKAIHRTWLFQNPTKIKSFCNHTIHTSFFMHLWQFHTKIAQKPSIHLFTNLLPRQKKSIHWTWLSQNPTKINSFCNHTFHTSFFMHLGQFPTKISQK